MNIKDLGYLVAVSELRSFVQAAERCCISQPTLSTQIKKLENRLGVKLFERSNKKVFPTEVGEQIIASSRVILEEVEHINILAEINKDPFSGNFRLGAFPTLSTYIFPSLVAIIKKSLPKIRLILVEEKTDKLIHQLRGGQIDAAFLSLPIFDESLVTQHLFSDDFKLAVAQDNVLAQKKSINTSDLHQMQLLLLDEGHCLRGQALQVCQLNDVEEQQDVRATGLEMLRQMVKAGTGVTIMPEIAIKEFDADIRYIPFEKPSPQRNIGLVWRKTTTRHQIIEQLIGITLESIQR